MGTDTGIGDMFEHLDLMRGDIDGDGQVTTADAQLTLRDYADRVAGKRSLLGVRREKAADVNGDGEVSVEDAQLILRYYVQNTLSGIPTAWEEL